jgi:hypothetical protein
MSQKNSEILGDEWIAPSVESEYPGLILSEYSIDSEDLIFQEDFITPKYSIDSEDLIFQEDSITPKYSIDSEDSIAPQEIDIDPLTGMARNSWPRLFDSFWNPTNNGSQVTALKDARLNIHPDSMWYQNRMRVTATVKVELSSSDMALINGGGLVLQSSVWGIDGGRGIFKNRDDHLFNFSDQNITGSGTYTFSTVVSRGVLDEDHSWFDRRDEIAASISLVSYSSSPPLNLQTRTNIFTGQFG